MIDSTRIQICILLMAVAITGWSTVSAEPAKPANDSEKVYFVCRSQYQIPLGHRVVEFDSPNLLAWFQKHWITESITEDQVYERTGSILGGRVYGFEAIWNAMEEWGKRPPQNVQELGRFVSSLEYPEGEVTFQEHAIQAKTDDDEIDIAWYLFDDEFARTHPERVVYLLKPEWEFDTTAGEKGAGITGAPFVNLTSPDTKLKEGTVYCVFISALDGMTLYDITGSYRFDGVRLPDFVEFLQSQKVPVELSKHGTAESAWPEELILLRAIAQGSEHAGMSQFLMKLGLDEMNRQLATSRAFSDLRYRLKNPKFLAGNREACAKDLNELFTFIESRSGQNRSVWNYTMRPPLVQTSEHFCQIRFHEHVSPKEGHKYRSTDFGWAFLFFDDQWVAAHPEIAQSILHYAAGWDILYKAN